MGKFENQVVVITGTSSGIGRVAAKMFVAEGAKVVGIARRAELQKSLEEEIAAEGGVFVPVIGDIREESAIDDLINTAGERFGRIDVLVNNAGIGSGFTACHKITNPQWDDAIATNLTAPMKATRKALQYMLKQESGGRIINVASVAGLRGTMDGPGYICSKHGLIGLTKNVAYTYAKQGIRCNVICPGGVDTRLCDRELLDATGDPEGRQLAKTGCSLMIRKSDPIEQANMILFLASEESSVVNGAIISTDSGFAAS